MAIKPYPFRPRVSERDIIEWMNTYRARGQLREAMVEAIRLHISVREGRFPDIARDKYGIAPPPLDRDAIREALLSVVPELAEEISKRLSLPAAPAEAPVRDEEAERFWANFADSRMFDDDDV